MPDKRRQRGPHPRDSRDFSLAGVATLRTAVKELSTLLSWGYSHKAAVTLVGDRHLLRVRQRKALSRCAASDAACQDRLSRRVKLQAIAGEQLWIDGYNALLTVEAAMSGGVILIGRDGAARDLASLSRHYRDVLTTGPALEAITAMLHRAEVGGVRWLLDRPISNSGRLAARIRAIGEAAGRSDDVDLVASPDRLLKETSHPIATADSAILDRCQRFVDLAGETIEEHVPNAWVIDFSGQEEEPV